MHTRTQGKVVQVLGGYSFVVEFHASTDGTLNDNPLMVRAKFPFKTKELAETALVECCKKIQAALIEKAGVKNLAYKENFGRLKI